MSERANHASPTTVGPDETRWSRALYRAVADRRRRAVLSLVREHENPIDPDELAPLLAARTAETGAEPPSEREREAAALSLRHEYLPTLEAAGLLRIDPIDGRVEPTDQSVPRADDIAAAVEPIPEQDAALDLLFSVLSNPLRRSLVVVLEGQPASVFPMGLADLAEAIEGYSKLTGDGTVAKRPRQEIVEDLHHSHLPKLADEGVLEYDDAEHAIDYEGHPVFAVV